MKRTLGLGITALGLLMIAVGFIFTPRHGFNALDSVNGIESAPGLVYGGFIVFGIGLVIFTATIAYYGTKTKNLN
jgi:hypothetical protein